MSYILQWKGYYGEPLPRPAEYLQSLIPSRRLPARWGPKKTAKRWKTRRGAERAAENWADIRMALSCVGIVEVA